MFAALFFTVSKAHQTASPSFRPDVSFVFSHLLRVAFAGMVSRSVSHNRHSKAGLIFALWVATSRSIPSLVPRNLLQICSRRENCKQIVLLEEGSRIEDSIVSSLSSPLYFSQVSAECSSHTLLLPCPLVLVNVPILRVWWAGNVTVGAELLPPPAPGQREERLICWQSKCWHSLLNQFCLHAAPSKSSNLTF